MWVELWSAWSSLTGPRDHLRTSITKDYVCAWAGMAETRSSVPVGRVRALSAMRNVFKQTGQSMGLSELTGCGHRRPVRDAQRRNATLDEVQRETGLKNMGYRRRRRATAVRTGRLLAGPGGLWVWSGDIGDPRWSFAEISGGRVGKNV